MRGLGGALLGAVEGEVDGGKSVGLVVIELVG